MPVISVVAVSLLTCLVCTEACTSWETVYLASFSLCEGRASTHVVTSPLAQMLPCCLSDDGIQGT